MQRAVLSCQNDSIKEKDVAFGASTPAAAAEAESFLSLAQLEKRHILQALEATHWVVSGEKGAAHLLRLNFHTLRSRMKKHGIQRPQA